MNEYLKEQVELMLNNGFSTSNDYISGQNRIVERNNKLSIIYDKNYQISKRLNQKIKKNKEINHKRFV